jgi:hypothetical protein
MHIGLAVRRTTADGTRMQSLPSWVGSKDMRQPRQLGCVLAAAICLLAALACGLGGVAVQQRVVEAPPIDVSLGTIHIVAFAQTFACPPQTPCPPTPVSRPRPSHYVIWVLTRTEQPDGTREIVRQLVALPLRR